MRRTNGYRTMIPPPSIPPATPPPLPVNWGITELPKDLISINDAAKLLGVRRPTLLRWVTRNRKLPCWKVRGGFRVSRADVLALALVRAAVVGGSNAS